MANRAHFKTRCLTARVTRNATLCNVMLCIIACLNHLRLQIITAVLVLIGLFSVAIFYIGTKEPREKKTRVGIFFAWFSSRVAVLSLDSQPFFVSFLRSTVQVGNGPKSGWEFMLHCTMHLWYLVCLFVYLSALFVYWLISEFVHYIAELPRLFL